MTPEETLTQPRVLEMPANVGMPTPEIAPPSAAPKAVKFTPTPFTWRDPSPFPRRQFV